MRVMGQEHVEQIGMSKKKIIATACNKYCCIFNSRKPEGGPHVGYPGGSDHGEDVRGVGDGPVHHALYLGVGEAR